MSPPSTQSHNIFQALKEKPLVGLLVCLSLMVIVTVPKLIEEGQLHGYFREPDLIETPVLKKYTQKSRRTFGLEQACMADVLVDGEFHSIRMDCTEWESVQEDSPVSLVRTKHRLSSVTFLAPSFYFDIVLFLIEIFGVFYFARLLLRKR